MKDIIIIKKDEFAELIEMLDSLKVIKCFMNNNQLRICFDINKMYSLISQIGIELIILNEEFEKLQTKETKILSLILNKARINGATNARLKIDYMICSIFFVENFYNYYNPIIKNGIRIVSLDPKFGMILNSLDEIKNVTTEKYSLDYLVYYETDNVKLELTEAFKLILNEIRNNI